MVWTTAVLAVKTLQNITKLQNKNSADQKEAKNSKKQKKINVISCNKENLNSVDMQMWRKKKM